MLKEKEFDPFHTSLIGLQPTKTRAELDSSTVLIFETNILRVSPVNVLKYFCRAKVYIVFSLCLGSNSKANLTRSVADRRAQSSSATGRQKGV